MISESNIEEVKTKIAKRCPPGDRWKSFINEEIIFDSLTDVLEFIFQEKKFTKFYIDAREGFVYSVETIEVEIKPPDIKKYSLYDEH